MAKLHSTEPGIVYRQVVGFGPLLHFEEVPEGKAKRRAVGLDPAFSEVTQSALSKSVHECCCCWSSRYDFSSSGNRINGE